MAGAVAGALAAAIGCGSDHAVESGSDHVVETAACIVGGDERAHFLLMTGEEANAIARVRIEAHVAGGTTTATCSAALLAPEWVLTARHCAPSLDVERAEVLFGAADVPAPSDAVVGGAPCGTQLRPNLSIPVREVLQHPDLDLLLLRLDHSPNARGVDIVPIRYAASDGAAVGQLLQLAGFGRNESGASSVLRFAVSEIASIEASRVTVDGRGRGGACAGDSGGPLLTRDSAGAVAAVGVLSNGSSDCAGVDDYVRLAAASSWLDSHLAPATGQSPPAACGGLGYEGRCYANTAVWCEAGQRRASACAAEIPCGWDAAAGGYRCIQAADDACRGITDLGRCEENGATTCVAGSLEQQTCAHGCVRSAATGAASCVP